MYERTIDQEIKRVIHEYNTEPIIHWPEGFSIQQVEEFYMALTKAKQDALAQVFLDKKAGTFSHMIMKSLDKWENKKKEELRIRRKKLLKQAKEITVPKATDYDVEEDPLVKRVKIILASKMMQLKRLLKKHPSVAKYIYNQLDALNKFVERGNYKQGIVFVNELLLRVEKIIASKEGEAIMLELAKTEDEARANIVRTMDALVERLQLDESQLLGKKDGLSSEYFAEEEDEEEDYKEKKRWYRKIRQKYPSGEEQASKRCTTYKNAAKKVKECLKEKDYEAAAKFLEICGRRVIVYGSIKRQKSPKKFRQYGVSKPIIDNEDKSIHTTFPIEYEEERKSKEEKKKEKAKQESQFNSLKEAFEDSTKEERTKLIQLLLKRKLRKMKEVE